MARMTSLFRGAILSVSVVVAGCGNSDYANAQTNPSAQTQIRENLGAAPAHIDTTTAYRLSAAFRGAAARALPAVVRVVVTTDPRVGTREPRSPLERLFPFDEEQPQRRGSRGAGSGFVIDQQGHILTNHHVVQNADRVQVTMVDGREYTAVVVGGDPQTDVAVIRIEPGRGETLEPVEFGSSDDLHVGDWVIALGNPLDLQFTVTQGIVSAKGRNLGILARDNGGVGGSAALEAFIQTDAVINPGNSGGPMVDLTGKVVGINSAIESPTGVWAGNGFAIPIDLARKVAGDIIEFGHVRRPRLGVTVGGVTAADAEVYRLPNVAGAQITSVQPGEVADRAGIQMGDVVVGLNGRPVRTQTAFMEELARQRPGDRVRLSIIRYGEQLEKTVTLGEFESATPTRSTRPARPAAQQLLGFSVQPLTAQDARALGVNLRSGVIVYEVEALGPAAGRVVRGTIIRKINGRDVNTVDDVERAAATLKPGQVVSLVVRFRGQEYDNIVNYRVQ